jgi:hypothetical protein
MKIVNAHHRLIWPGVCHFCESVTLSAMCDWVRAIVVRMDFCVRQFGSKEYMAMPNRRRWSRHCLSCLISIVYHHQTILALDLRTNHTVTTSFAQIHCRQFMHDVQKDNI